MSQLIWRCVSLENPVFSSSFGNRCFPLQHVLKFGLLVSSQLSLRFYTEEYTLQHNYKFAHCLDFFGVTLTANTAATRQVKEDALQEQIRKIIGPWRGGRFLALNLRPHSINCFALSKLQYWFSVIYPRKGDTNYFLSQTKPFIYADLPEMAEKKMLYKTAAAHR